MKAFCSHCGGIYALRKDGKLRVHTRYEPGVGFRLSTWEHCAGSGETPARNHLYRAPSSRPRRGL